MALISAHITTNQTVYSLQTKARSIIHNLPNTNYHQTHALLFTLYSLQSSIITLHSFYTKTNYFTRGFTTNAIYS